ncbi:MAG: aldo/keto reductase [Christensenellales bacterium]|jgi:predicted aldo/keto reductase-like oxidoreductase
MLEKVKLGKTHLEVTRLSFGCLPLQRTKMDEATRILRRAYDEGVNFYDTARGYTDSEEKIGSALRHVRQNIVIATKTPAKTYDAAMEHIETSLKMLQTDYIDLLQLHNPEDVDHFDDPDSAYQALLRAKEQGKILHIGITNHHYDRGMRAIDSELFETIQFPFSMLSSRQELDLARHAAETGMGFIAMKGLCGGLFDDVTAPFAFMRQHRHVVPIWGIQRMSELEDFLRLSKDPPAFDDKMQAQIAVMQKELGDSFCRGCGYCLPCPAEIPLPTAMRMSLMLGRATEALYLREQFVSGMQNIKNCIHCNACKERCPYGLDIPGHLPWELENYNQFLSTLGKI